MSDNPLQDVLNQAMFYRAFEGQMLALGHPSGFGKPNFYSSDGVHFYELSQTGYGNGMILTGVYWVRLNTIQKEIFGNYMRLGTISQFSEALLLQTRLLPHPFRSFVNQFNFFSEEKPTYSLAPRNTDA